MSSGANPIGGRERDVENRMARGPVAGGGGNGGEVKKRYTSGEKQD